MGAFNVALLDYCARSSFYCTYWFCIELFFLRFFSSFFLYNWLVGETEQKEIRPKKGNKK